MLDTWIAASIVAVVAGAVGFFCVLRGSAFVAHAVPQGAFAGAAGASLLGLNTLFGLGVFSVLGALTIGWLGRRGRHDVVTALALVTMLGLGALFLSFSVEYEPEIFSLLFGQVLGISKDQLPPIAILGALGVAAIALLFRPLLWSSVTPEMGQTRGVRAGLLDACFLLVVALTASLTVPVVGALLTFSLLVAPAGAARCFVAGPLAAALLSIALALVTVWLAIALGYLTEWPIGFFVGGLGACGYATGRVYAWRRGGRKAPEAALELHA
ncbi:MAG: metal ABC transporter permease [Candidatus Dormibacteraceae bacterium]